MPLFFMPMPLLGFSLILNVRRFLYPLMQLFLLICAVLTDSFGVSVHSSVSQPLRGVTETCPWSSMPG